MQWNDINFHKCHVRAKAFCNTSGRAPAGYIARSGTARCRSHLVHLDSQGRASRYFHAFPLFHIFFWIKCFLFFRSTCNKSCSNISANIFVKTPGTLPQLRAGLTLNACRPAAFDKSCLKLNMIRFLHMQRRSFKFFSNHQIYGSNRQEQYLLSRKSWRFILSKEHHLTLYVEYFMSIQISVDCDDCASHSRKNIEKNPTKHAFQTTDANTNVCAP